MALFIAIPIGIYSAVRQETVFDYVGRSFSILALAVPSFWLGTMVVILPAMWWGWTPPNNIVPFFEQPWENLKTFITPALILGASLSAVTMRMTRSMMLEVLRQDYVRTAWAKGLSERTVVLRHAVKNAMIPVVTLIGVLVPFFFGGTVIIEQIFQLPGIGQLLIFFIEMVVSQEVLASPAIVDHHGKWCPSGLSIGGHKWFWPAVPTFGVSYHGVAEITNPIGVCGRGQPHGEHGEKSQANKSNRHVRLPTDFRHPPALGVLRGRGTATDGQRPKTLGSLSAPRGRWL